MTEKTTAVTRKPLQESSSCDSYVGLLHPHGYVHTPTTTHVRSPSCCQDSRHFRMRLWLILDQTSPAAADLEHGNTLIPCRSVQSAPSSLGRHISDRLLLLGTT